MKKIGKLLLMLILCFGFVGCSNNKNVANITEKFEEKNYKIFYARNGHYHFKKKRIY